MLSERLLQNFLQNALSLHINHITIAGFFVHHLLPRSADFARFDQGNLRSDTVFGTKIDNLLGFFNAADQRACKAVAADNRGKRCQLVRLIAAPDTDQTERGITF